MEITPTWEEIAFALASLPDGKTAGTDSIPVEFYKIFASQIKIYSPMLWHQSLRARLRQAPGRQQKLSSFLKRTNRPLRCLHTDP